jgi:dCTP deaminase
MNTAQYTEQPVFLTRDEIIKARQSGDIHIEPFREEHLSPNSIDVTLNSQLVIYDLKPGEALDVKRDNPTINILIPAEGLVLEPGILYIGMTNESATSHRYIPMFEGRSSIGRLGINTHITAGFGDLGWGYSKKENGEILCHSPTWTLEICVVHPVKVYADIRIGQVYFVEPKGKIEWYQGKYSTQRKPQPSKSFVDFRL